MTSDNQSNNMEFESTPISDINEAVSFKPKNYYTTQLVRLCDVLLLQNRI